MSNQSILGIEGGGGSLGGDLVQPTEHVLIRRPLQRVLELRRRSIDDVVNNPVVKNEILGYWKVYKQIGRRQEVLELERQWNAVGL
jgi:hypothetical protein